MAPIVRLVAFPCAAFLLAHHATGSSRPVSYALSGAVPRAQQELIVAARALARQKQLHALGEPQRDVDEAQQVYEEKRRALARLAK